MRALVAVVALVTGCNLYNSASDDDALCPVVPSALILVRNPYTGECIQRNPSVCDGCKPCPLDLTQDYAPCDGPCEALAEEACLGTSHCRAAYEVDRFGSHSAFVGCWATETGKPPPIRACAELDVLACPYRDDCAAWYVTSAGARRFNRCTAELDPLPACDALTGEAQCAARGDCQPIYRGDSCTCTPTSCTCETRTYQRCNAKPD